MVLFGQTFNGEVSFFCIEERKELEICAKEESRLKDFAFPFGVGSTSKSFTLHCPPVVPDHLPSFSDITVFPITKIY